MKLITYSNIQLMLGGICLVFLAGCGGSQDPVSKEQSQVISDSSSSLDLMALSTEATNKSLEPFNFGSSLDSSVTPSANVFTSGQKTYTPADIRAAYQLPPLPASWTRLSELQKAQMGAGQTVYVVNAFHDPNIVEELKAFNDEFKLPGCTTLTIPVNASLPLVAADKNAGCQFSVVYANQNTFTATAPAFNAGWAEEIALDVQWVHATAPLARIVLIEAPNNLIPSLLSAINLANAMGPGVVSMSFGGTEGNWTSSADSSFSSADMTYVAATGDSGAEVNWPSVSSQVLAVGGTSLNSFSGSRSETSWSRTGGGVSLFVAAPEYQKYKLRGLPNATKRSVADVAFNADPDTGQFVAVISNGQLTWRRFGGTSIAAPQWAGIVAITNATRALNGQGPMGLVQNVLYKAASSIENFFSTIVNDVDTAGRDEQNISELNVGAYYDPATGLGTPNVSRFMSLAGGNGGSSVPVTPPPVTPPSDVAKQPPANPPAATPPVNKPGSSPPQVSDLMLDAMAGSSVAFSMSLSAPNPVSWNLSDAPSGMLIDGNGLVKWPEAIAGKYSITAIATDSVTGLIGRGSVTLNISAAKNTVQMESAKITGEAGKVLVYKIRAQPAYSLSFVLDKSAPPGLSVIAHTGTMIWEKPVAGNYDVKVFATDKKTAATASADIHLKINPVSQPAGPQINATSINGMAGFPLAALVGVVDPWANSIRINISGAPAGMSYSEVGGGLLIRWRKPVSGSYTLVITATDNHGLSSQVSVPVTVN